MRQYWTFIACALFLMPISARGEESKTTKIHIVYQSYYERIRPGYAEGNLTEEMTVLLSPNGHIEELFKSQSPKVSKSWDSQHVLGESQWHVSARNRLTRTKRTTQNVRTDTIVVTGNTCSASWKIELLPGYTEYSIYSITLGEYAFYRQARMLSSTCEIESQ